MKYSNVITESPLSAYLKFTAPDITFDKLVLKQLNTFSDANMQLQCIIPSHSRILKTLWQKEKLLMMSNFAFSYNVF